MIRIPSICSYGVRCADSSSLQMEEDSSLSPNVRNIASLVYAEFERIVSKYGDGVVDGIVPIIIRTLEQIEQLHESNDLLQSSNLYAEFEVKSVTSRLERETASRRLAEEVRLSLIIHFFSEFWHWKMRMLRRKLRTASN